MITDMDKTVAKEILESVALELASRDRDELAKLISSAEIRRVKSSSGQEYNVESTALWDDAENQTLRIMISVDDGGMRSFLPMSKSFLVMRSGEVRF